MAKDLPYFKFIANDWLSGSIQLLSDSEKGTYIDLTAMLWKEHGSIALDKILARKLRLNYATVCERIDSYCELNIMVCEDSVLSIKFISDQIDSFGEVSKKNAENAKKRWSKSKDECDRMPIREEKRREEKRKEDKKIIKPITNNKDIELPSFINPASWNDFLTHRKELKKPLTPTSMKGQLKKLEKFESSFPGGANISLEQTVNNGWQGLFEPKMEEFNFDSAPWKVLNTGERVKLDLNKLIVYSENGKKHEDYETDAQGGVSC